ncbi:hypothetical protein Tco_0938489 [Tanacetum coccineum]|uniref:Uncharacterized protein n=1 Tax=Tanacetum coccineum TaxID=301880 RepID=A0ABQ5DNG7_9ASTR
MDKGVADTIKNHKRQHDDDKDPLARPNQGKKTERRRTKESESSMKPSTTKETSKDKAPTKSSKTGKSVTTQEPIKEPIAEVVMDDLETTTNEDVVNDANQPEDYVAPNTNKPSRYTWFKQPSRPPTPDPEWNKRQVLTNQPEQPWFNHMVSTTKDPHTFDELMATPINFYKYAMNRLQDNLTQEFLVGPVYNLLKGTCTGDHFPFDLTNPLPLKGRPGRLTVAPEYVFNNGLEFLKSLDPKKKYTTSITKTKAARYKIVGIKDMILSVVSVSVNKLHGYGYLEEIMVRRADRQLFQLDGSDIVDLIMALLMFTRSLIIKHRVEDLQLGLESFQMKLNITTP